MSFDLQTRPTPVGARGLGAILATSAASGALRAERVPVWQCSYDVTDRRAQVGRRFGDGSPRQGRIIISAIVKTAFSWIDKVRHLTDERGKPYKLRWELVRTLSAVLGFIDFKSGNIIASYDLIAAAAGCCAKTAKQHLKILRQLKWIDWVRRSDQGDDGRPRQAPNAYMFEISRLPFEAQVELRQHLSRQGVTLEAHPERKGSGPVPSRVQRRIRQLTKALAGPKDRRSGAERDQLMDRAAFVRAEMDFFGDIPAQRWPELRHPGDLAAQEAYARFMGIASLDCPSVDTASDSPP